MTAASLLALLATLHGGQHTWRPAAPLPPEAGTSTIAGTVLDAQSKRPMAGVDVRISGSSGGAPRIATVTTNAAGAYAFADIVEGYYTVTATAPGYLQSCYADRDTSGPCPAMNLLRDQQRSDVDFTLTKPSGVRGRVVDQKGSRVAGAMIRMVSLRSEIAGTNVFSNTSCVSAADGSFELRNIAPGVWTLEVELPAQPGSLRLPAMFYPGVIDNDEAARIELSAGRVNDGLVFVLPEIVDHAITIRVSPGALPVADITTSLIQLSPLATRPIALNDQGWGTIKGITAGRYFVEARGLFEDQAWAAFAVADFVPPALDVPLQMLPAGRITGRIVSQGGGAVPFDGILVAAPWIDADVEINPLALDEGRVAGDGSFRIDGLFGRRALRLIGLPREWSVVSVLHGRSDVSRGVDVPFESTVDITIIVARR